MASVKKQSKEVADIKQALKHKPPETPLPASAFLSLGCTVLNLAISGKRSGGIAKGLYLWLVGDSSSGKTFTAYTCLAEAALNKHFDGYRFIADQAEDGALMDVEKFFGKRVLERLEPPRHDAEGNPIYSSTVEEFFHHLDDAHKSGQPFIYILDSFDALDTTDDIRKFEETKKIRRGESNKKETGSYAMAKPKLTSQGIRRAVGRLKKSGSILIIISQTRDNIGADAMFNPKTVAGGRALKFYASVEIWTSVKRQIKRNVRGKNRSVGIICKAAIKKNRITGRSRTVDIPIYYSHGISDIDACIAFLVDEGHWKGSETGDKIEAKDFDYKGSREGLVRKIEEEGLEKELKILVSKVWQEIDAATAVQRKRRYV